jgi:hypothetical protein
MNARSESVPLGDLSDALKMRRINPFGVPKREPDAVQRYRRVTTDGVDVAQRRPAAHVVLGLNLHPGHLRTSVEHNLVILKGQPDPGFCRDQAGFADVRGMHQLRSP